MPTQVIDLRSFIKNSIDFGPGYNTTSIISSELTDKENINIRNLNSEDSVLELSTYSEDGKYYTLVGYNKVGDGSVVGP
jgi:hypothetical protein